MIINFCDTLLYIMPRYKSVHILSAIFLLILLSTSVSAQISYGGRPLPLDGAAGMRSAAAVPFVEMSPVDNQAALWRSEMENEADRFKSLEFAHKFFVNLSPDNSGVRFVSGNMNVWRVGIRSKDAYSINILFSEFNLPEGSALFVYNSNQTEVLGSYTHMNNSDLNFLPVQPVEGDELIVEYQEPVDAAFKGKLKIGEVNHDFRGILRATEPRDPGQDCHPNLVCYPEDIEPGSGVVGLIINGSTYCTGAMVNNSANDSIPYLLTATHCLNRDYSPSFLSNRKYDMVAGNIVAFFGYQSPVCDMKAGNGYGSMRGTVQMTMASADSVLILESHDISLLKFKEIPPVEYQPYYLGWSSASSPKAPFHGIHHPNGGVKKVAVENDKLEQGSFNLSNMWKNVHWVVRAWDVAATEGGSSGSPLVDADKRIVGLLTGGDSFCSSPKGPDQYSSFYKAWDITGSLDNPLSLSDYLDPEDTGLNYLDGFNPYKDNPYTKSFNYQFTDSITETYIDNTPMFATNNTLGYSEFAEEFYADKPTKLAGVYIASASNKKTMDVDIRIRVYADNSGKPGMLIKELPLNYSYKYWATGGFGNSNRDMSRNVENYVQFDPPLDVEGYFYVSYSDRNNVANGFSVLNVPPRKKGSDALPSAWLKNSEGWMRSSDIMDNSVNTSLLISSYVIGNGISLPKPVIEKPEIKAYHNRESSRIVIDSNRDLTSWELFGTSGVKLFEGKAENSIKRTSIAVGFLPKGIYLLKVSCEGKQENIKVLVR